MKDWVKRHQPAAVWLALVFVALLAVVIIATTVGNDNVAVTRWLAVTTAAFTVAKFAWDVIKDANERDKKNEDSKEKVKVTYKGKSLVQNQIAKFVINIYNAGKCTINIKYVTAHHKPKSDLRKAATIRLASSVEPITRGMARHIMNKLLEPHEDSDFFLDNRSMLTALQESDPEEFSITVESHLGTIATIEGKDFIPLLKADGEGIDLTPAIRFW